MTAASFVGFTGFTVVMPFLPLYVRELGVTDTGEAALWAGLCLGVTPAVTGALSPWWGRIADRYGRKLLVQRSLLSFVIIMAAMAWATHAWHLLALRTVQGVFAGYGGLTMAMAAESAPRDRLARALGLVQTAQRIGPALGPVLGGLVAAAVGIRHAFFVTSGFYVVALVLVTWLYRDPVSTRGRDQADAPRHGARRMFLSAPGVLTMMAGIFVLTFVDRSLGPVLALWAESRGVAPAHVTVVSGVLFSAVAFGAAVGNHLCDVALRRWTPRVVIAVASAAGAAGLAAFLAGTATWWLAATLAVFGVAGGVAMTAAYTEGGRRIPPGFHGEGFGFLNGANLAGLALSPVVAGLLSRRALWPVFAIDLALLAGLAIVLGRRPGRQS